MLFVTNGHLKPGMILAKDIYLHNNNNFYALLLTKGQVLNNSYIKKIHYHDIDGAYIESIGFEDIEVDSYIDDNLKSESLSQIKDVYYEFKMSSGKINDLTIKRLSSIVDTLISEILCKDDLTYNVIDFKNFDSYTYHHCLNVAVLSISTGISIGLSESELHDLGLAGLLHDIGKMSIPVEILNKPGKLTDEEFELIKTHPVSALKFLENMVSYKVLRAIESHHEKLDGTGYPYGKKADNISYYAKILAVCDVYDALTSDRSYRKSAFPNEVIEYIMGCADTHFDYEILNHFIRIIVAYPIGTFVKLSNGKLAVVVKNYRENILRPIVRIIDDDGTVGEDVDLLYDSDFMNITIVDMGYDYSNSGLSAVLESTYELKLNK
ncbi:MULTISPECIES: HD-GYP domain-containing protein [unclassified Sedimentibacter]|uniref:HD-GYP domain-containing protein n=1 Tax=unclassified Sedimentibacter TaxID=2649220 RepID=UPI0027E2090A|nr:HD-GYP domain-containing protein [Sedimentibacter sp. MB35-C1]WMJ78105.1 HD-GYP domain-containing protein [Sedimentibacter sp. MB35-C1]